MSVSALLNVNRHYLLQRTRKKNELFGSLQEWYYNVPFYTLYFVPNRTGIGICLQW